MTSDRRPPSPPATEELEDLGPADLQAFVDDLYGPSKSSGVVDDLIRSADARYQ